MPIALTFLLASAAAEPPIIVTAPRTEQALAKCLARGCGVREDAIASIRHAQAQFANGAYPDARKTLLASLHRNRRATNEDPRALSALWHALARVTMHNGDMQEYRRAALRSGSILARAASVTPGERVRGEVQIADALSTTGDVDGAVRRYRAVGRDAESRGDQELAQMMRLRSIYARSSFDGRPAARRALERAAGDAELTPRARMSALAFAAQLQERSKAKAEQLLDSVPVQAAGAPVTLLWAPRNSFMEQREAVNRALANGDSTLFSILQPRSSEARRYGWADIGFRVRPDGRVSDVAVLRGSENRRWIQEAARTVAGRRYAPFQSGGTADGVYRIERVTLTYDQQTPVGSLIRRRSGMPIFRWEDLRIEGAAGAP